MTFVAEKRILLSYRNRGDGILGQRLKVQEALERTECYRTG